MNILNKGINFYTKNKRKIDPHLTFLGAYLTTKFLIRRARAILSTLTMKQVDIAERYGKGSYALITGGASGIGKQFALDLARKGFNLIIVDFNQNNLEQTQQELLKIKTDIMVKTMLLDFSQGNNPEFFKKFQQEISGIDISILINNVGTAVGGFGHFQRIPIQNVLNSFNVNLTSAIMVTHSVINQMLLRNKYQSLILNLSSASALAPVPFFFGYGAQKVAMTNFFDALSLELRGNKNIDILTITPTFVNTTMIGHDKGPFTIEPQELVENTWKYVGKTNQVVPNWNHQFQIYIIGLLPDCLRKKLEIKSYSGMAEHQTANQEN